MASDVVDLAAVYLGSYYAEEFWRRIAVNGLHADDFEFGESEVRGFAWKVSNKPSGESFHASEALRTAMAYASVMGRRPNHDPVDYGYVRQDEFFKILQKWLVGLKSAKIGVRRLRDVPTPIGSAEDQAGENRPFTPAEQAEIANQLRAIRESVRTNYRLTATQTAAIDRALEEIREGGRKFGKKDFKTMVYGVIFGLIVNDAIPPEVAQHIFTGVLHGIAHLLGGPPPGPWMLGP